MLRDNPLLQIVKLKYSYVEKGIFRTKRSGVVKAVDGVNLSIPEGVRALKIVRLF
jgi:ABC-type oligopeptide transport system ATPase subunit